jgi:hypothetical protein
MRTLKFIVDGLQIKPDPNCDFTGLVLGTQGYLKAEFSFSKEWDGFVKVASFWKLNKEQPAQILKDGKSCIIPAEALDWTSFEVGVMGKKGDTVLKTIRTRVHQERGV